MKFRTASGNVVPAITAEQMRQVDRVAMELFDLAILQMMENAGRTLAQNVIHMLRSRRGAVVVLAGSGGNGGGGLCCARHLRNHGVPVEVVLSKDPAGLTGAAARQLRTLRRAGLEPLDLAQAEEVLRGAALVVDALVGYSLRGAPRGRVDTLIQLCNRHARRVVALDVPSGLDATTGEAPGRVVQPERTLTLALPKTGLAQVAGEIYLADIGIPPAVFESLGIRYEPPFEQGYWVQIERVTE
ncbi:MAG: NAD(P)H-hydrate epimerase [Anaerolineae bacterium]|jgi:NAD(P)H-hydrate epimerase